MVNPTVLEIFQWDLVVKALVLVNATVLEIFQWDLVAKALVLVHATPFYKKRYYKKRPLDSSFVRNNDPFKHKKRS